MSQPTTPTQRELQAIVAAKLQVKPEQVPLDESLLEDLGLDSFDVISVVVEIEQRFPPVTLSDKSAEKLRTLRDVASYIDHELNRA